MKINIRYLIPGLITAEIPDGTDLEDKDALRALAADIIETKTTQELLEGLKTIESKGQFKIEDEIFDENPWPEAVEESESEELLMNTKLWNTFMAGDEIIY